MYNNDLGDGVIPGSILAPSTPDPPITILPNKLLPSADNLNTAISVLPPPLAFEKGNTGKLFDVVLPRIIGLPLGSTMMLCGNSSPLPPK